MIRCKILWFVALSAVWPQLVLADAPYVDWASDPVGPNETVMLMGGGLQGGTAELIECPSQDASRWRSVAPLQSSLQCLKFVLPADWTPGVYNCRVRSEQGVSNVMTLNAADPWWFLGDQGETASPGGSLRIFGKCFAPDKQRPAGVELTDAGGKVVRLSPREASGYALRVDLPADLPAGEYAVSVHNGCGGQSAWRDAGRLVVRARRPWKSDVFNVKDFGGDKGKALLAALKKAAANGGGVVYLPRGRYPVEGHLVIPDKTVLKGESMELVSLYWPDFDDPPTELLSGVDFGIESLSLYCQNYKNLVAGSDKSDGMFLRHVRIRADGYFMMVNVSGKFHDRHGPSDWNDCQAAVRLRGKNFEVTDCDIVASGMGIFSFFAQCGVIAHNRVFYGRGGFDLENADQLIFEDNLIAGSGPLAAGNSISSFWSAYCRNIWFAHNRIEKVFGGDRETMTLDAGGGVTPGPLAAAEGTTLDFGRDIAYRTYHPVPLADWRGAAVVILDGKGAMQYRLVAKRDGRRVEVDRPWTVLPDKTSRICIGPFRGHNLFIGNTIEDGGAFQLYAAAHESIVAENHGARMDGFSVWGLNPHGWALQPTWFSQFLDNEIVEGNAYGSRTGGFGTVAYDESGGQPGPLVRGAVFRRNVCRNNASINIGGLTAGVLVEHCTVKHTERAIIVDRGASDVLLRENATEDVERPVVNEGKSTMVVPLLSFTMKSLDGKDVDLGKYQGKVVLVVNVASKCGLTPQYKQLQALHDKYAKDGLAILGFPCNQFLSQEPGTAGQIRQFCTVKYGVTFDLFAKVEVNGKGACDLYKTLTALDTKPVGPGKISWNFEKFILGRDGEVVARFGPRTKPDDPQIVKVIEAELAKK